MQSISRGGLYQKPNEIVERTMEEIVPKRKRYRQLDRLNSHIHEHSSLTGRACEASEEIHGFMRFVTIARLLHVLPVLDAPCIISVDKFVFQAVHQLFLALVPTRTFMCSSRTPQDPLPKSECLSVYNASSRCPSLHVYDKG